MASPNCFLRRSISGSVVISVVITGAVRGAGAGLEPASGAAFGGASAAAGARGGVGLTGAGPVSGGAGIVFCGVAGEPVSDAPSTAGVFDGLSVPGSAASSLASVLGTWPAGSSAFNFASPSSAGETEPAMGGSGWAFSGTSAPMVSGGLPAGSLLPACAGGAVLPMSRLFFGSSAIFIPRYKSRRDNFATPLKDGLSAVALNEVLVI